MDVPDLVRVNELKTGRHRKIEWPAMSYKGKVAKTFREKLERYQIDAFRDTPLSSIDLHSYRDFVIERLLQYGGMEGIRWLLETREHAAIKSVVLNNRNLSKATASSWSACFDIPPERIRRLSEHTLSPLK